MAESKNTAAAEMTFERIDRPSRLQQRQALNNRADDMTRDELKAEAAALGIDTAGATSKADVRKRVTGESGA